MVRQREKTTNDGEEKKRDRKFPHYSENGGMIRPAFLLITFHGGQLCLPFGAAAKEKPEKPCGGGFSGFTFNIKGVDDKHPESVGLSP